MYTLYRQGRATLGAALLAAGLLAAPARAHEAGDWLLKVGASQVRPKSNNGSVLNGSVDLDANNSVRPSFTVTYMATRNIGIELLAAWPFEHDIRGSGLGRIASTKQLPPTLSVQWHFLPDSTVQPYVGVGLNYTTFFDTKTHGALEGSDLRLGDSWGLAGQLGVDVKLNERWFLNADLRYIDISSKPITLIVPYAPSGFADTRVRLLARKLGESLQQSIVVENKAGAGGVIGTNLVAKAAPDGYTIGTGNLAPMAVNPTLMPAIPYDAQKDLAPVVLIENSPLVLSVHNTLPVKNLQDLIALARQEPGKLTFGSSGVGGAHHLSGEMFREQAGIDIVHVPYKGGSLAATDLMGGHITMMFEMGYSALPSIQSKKVHPIAVTSLKRLDVLPDVPTMAESGLPGFESYNWQGIVAPAGTPAPIIARLNAEFNKILKDPEVVKAIADTDSQAGGGTPEEFGAFIKSETEKWAKVIKAGNISLQ